MRNNISLTLCLSFLGIAIGLLLTYNHWPFYYVAIVALCVILIKNKFDKEEAGFLVKLFLVSLVLRMAAAMLLRPYVILYGNGLDIGDGMVYSINSFVISQTLKMDLTQAISQLAVDRRLMAAIPLAHVTAWNLTSVLPDWVGTLPPVNKYQVTIYTYLLSMLYYFFGFKPLVGIFLNCLLGSGLGLCVYSVVKKLSDNKTASRLAAVLISFFPSLFLWSVTNQKDSLYIFVNFLIVVSLIKALKERRWGLLVLLPLLSFVQFLLRPNSIFLLLLFYIAVCLSVLWLWIWRRKLTLSLLVFLLTCSLFLPHTQKFITKATYKIHQVCAQGLLYHTAQVYAGGASYKIIAERYYVEPRFGGIVKGASFKEIFKAYVLGIAHFVFEPFPSRIHNFQTWISYSQTMLAYFLLPFSILGMAVALKKDLFMFIVLFSYLFVFSSVIALSEGNVGGLFRHRDIVTPVFLIFCSIGLVAFLGRLSIYAKLQKLP